MQDADTQAADMQEAGTQAADTQEGPLRQYPSTHLAAPPATPTDTAGKAKAGRSAGELAEECVRAAGDGASDMRKALPTLCRCRQLPPPPRARAAESSGSASVASDENAAATSAAMAAAAAKEEAAGLRDKVAALELELAQVRPKGTHHSVNAQTLHAMSEEEHQARQASRKLEADLVEQLQHVQEQLDRATAPCRAVASAAATAAAAEGALQYRVAALAQQVDELQASLQALEASAAASAQAGSAGTEEGVLHGRVHGEEAARASGRDDVVDGAKEWNSEVLEVERLQGELQELMGRAEMAEAEVEETREALIMRKEELKRAKEEVAVIEMVCF